MVVMSGIRKPVIVGLGGTTKADSSTEKALRLVLSNAERLGAATCLIGGPFLARLPLFDPNIANARVSNSNWSKQYATRTVSS